MENFINLGSKYELNIKKLFENPIADNPNQTIIYKDLKSFTYSEFRARVKQLTNLLRELGIKRGDTVAMMDYDSHRYLEMYFAVPMIGAKLHMINIRLSSEQILYTIDHAEDDVLFLNLEFLQIISNIKGRIDTVKKYVIINDGAPAEDIPFTYAGEYEDLLSRQPQNFIFEDIDENTIATIFYTTGTTGMPKGVYFTHRQLVLHTLGVIASISTSAGQNFTQRDVYMPVTPMFHVHAWGFPYIATFMGVKQVYPGKYIPDALLDLISKHRVTFSHCVPTILHMILNSPKAESVDLSAWKVLIGGTALPLSLCNAALAKGIDIFTGYGMSETCPFLTFSQLRPGEENLSQDEQAQIRIKTGRPLALVELKVVDEYSHEVKPNGEDTGEIVVKTPWLTPGYFKDVKNSKELWGGGFLHTGDFANIDEKGFVKITDRGKDLIKVGGEWISSLGLEDIIHRHEKVVEVAVIGIFDGKWGERPLALIVAKDGEQKQIEKEILDLTKEYIKKGILAREGMLIKFRFVEAIEKTSVGKIDKKLLRQKYPQG